ncbi:Enoyl-CoA hydratase 2 [Morus notabilis]|uniref:Enoyl-CoA hydratase 2 n=1 Tax=Morus notabilis TaxID=981085 RepID=W9RF87_9ROSA|nr:Enoyl-CoA hydratase 2 [Morus notabilis]
MNLANRDAVIYALGVGACQRDPVDEDELNYVYHKNGQQFVQVLPTFATVYSFRSLPIDHLVPGLEYDPRLVLYGQHYIELYKPLPSCGRIQNKVSLAGLHDKGKAAIVEHETKSYNESGELLCLNRSTLYLRGAGGFSSSSRAFSYSNYPANQPLLYRLSGDYNALHSDPVVAKNAGFTRPIMHGLCTLGFAVRAIIKCICKGDPNLVKSLVGRFLLHAYPGETLVTEMWLQDKRDMEELGIWEVFKVKLALLLSATEAAEMNHKDAVIYALGVGACQRDAVDDDELKYVYHENGQQFVQVLPTFSAIFSSGSTPIAQLLPGLEYDPRLLLHGQQYIEIYKPLPSSGRIQNKVALAGLHDKGKAAIVELETKSYNESGELLCMNRSTVYLRGAGGFSRSSRPFSYSNYPANQALLYRLSGDYNPLHSDPVVAKVAGFTRPILHGLCTLGFAVRAIIKCICKGDPNKVKSIFGRFLLHVYPGETLITEMWLQDKRVIYQVRVKERNRIVLSGFVDLHGLTSSL